MFPIAHGESETDGDQKPRRNKLVFRYSSLDLGMHWASTKLKLNFYLITLYVAFTWWKKLHIFVFLFWNTMKQTHPSNQTFKVTKESISSVHLNPKTKRIFPAGNPTPVSCVTGGDTYHYTTEELSALDLGLGLWMGKRPISL